MSVEVDPRGVVEERVDDPNSPVAQVALLIVSVTCSTLICVGSRREAPEDETSLGVFEAASAEV